MSKEFAEQLARAHAGEKQVPDWLRDYMQDARGQTERGNLDLYRPEIRNEDGSTSTVRSMSFNDGPGREVLVPTAYDGALHTDDEAVRRYYATGEHLGKFKTPEDATRYAESLHSAYEQGQYKLEHRPPPDWLEAVRRRDDDE
jgi:hypothetical protein